MQRLCRLQLAVAVAMLVSTGARAFDQSPQVGPPFETDIRKFEEADAQQAPAEGGIVFVGSSSIVRWSTLKEDFPGIPVINRGFGGSAISDSVRYARRIVTKYKPKMVVFFAGSNDLASGKKSDEVVADFRKFVAIVHEDLPKTKIVFLSITPAPSRQQLWPAMQEVNHTVQAICKKGPNLQFVDFWSQFLTKEGGPRPEIFVEDQLHMNPKGYAIWVAGLKSVVK
ncbi:MAG: hypothetical protein JSS65_02420 [Armatimonadetes bacterium]|nr:hypothetical protein [Armatimonadota bacterium]